MVPASAGPVSPGPRDPGQRSPLHRRFDSPTNCRRVCAKLMRRIQITVDARRPQHCVRQRNVRSASVRSSSTQPQPEQVLRGRLPAAGDHHPTAIPGRFVGQLPPELTEAHIADGLRQVMVLQHARHVEVFNHHDGLGFRQSAGELMQRVGPLIGHAAMQARETLRRLACGCGCPSACARRRAASA